MSTVVVVLSILLAAVFLGSGLAKLANVDAMKKSAEQLGYSQNLSRLIGALEVAAAAGLIIGLFWTPIGLAAAIGLTVLMLGAVYYHVRAKDAPAHILPPALLTLTSAATAVLIAL
ncbi:DoxX family protein [Amycolatopsis magusensis]|uniref:Membrane protein YphA (DoxX/SURF4 family) n=1 Tax=Amycolatopsis magusensis TaxID=882444 RepID=A0ABS4Q1F7_9PSEU|nr:DoxX family protein [Amycolatopsis magusensis]MBP2184944.1 putative membrane protein YphA (DoxX/SURF4 family) [Amycolatopsis magusensis]MDI5982373.1 DoxX family protein [Amycolatopsis magusensis]